MDKHTRDMAELLARRLRYHLVHIEAESSNNVEELKEIEDIKYAMRYIIEKMDKRVAKYHGERAHLKGGI